jgi:hypothetical protein
MRYLPLLLVFFFFSPAFAKEKITHKETEYTLDANSEIKDKLRVKFYKKDGETCLAKKIKLKDDLKGWEIVNA